MLGFEQRAKALHEVRAVRQPGQRILVRLAPQRLDLRGLGLEQRAHAQHHAVHRLSDPPQFGHTRLFDLHVAPFDQRVRLRHRRIERAPDAAHAHRGQGERGHAEQPEPAHRPRAAAPQLVVRVGHVADNLDAAERAPAVADLRHAGGRVDRQQRRKPGRRVLRRRRGLARERDAAVRAQQAHAAVEAGVELRCQQQLHQGCVAMLLRQRQRQALRVVAVLDPQLRLQRVARRTQVDPHRTGQCQQHHGGEQPPNLSHQAHWYPLRRFAPVPPEGERAPWERPGGTH